MIDYLIRAGVSPRQYDSVVRVTRLRVTIKASSRSRRVRALLRYMRGTLRVDDDKMPACLRRRVVARVCG